MIRHLKPVPSRSASGKVAEIYRQIEKEFLLGEPLTLHSSIPGLLAAVWSTFRETFIAGRVKRALKEAVAVTVSRNNRCPYCLDAHAMALRSTSSSGGVEQLREGITAEVQDPELRAVAQWAESATLAATQPIPAPPVPSEDAAELMGALVWMHYANRMVNLFIGEGLIPVSSNLLGLRSLIEGVGGRYFHRMFNRPAVPGESLVHLEAGRKDPPKNLAWASGSEVLSKAFAGLVEAVERGADESIPGPARAWFLEQLNGVEGQSTGMSRRWLESELAGLDESLHPIGRLLLLASRAPYQVTDSDIEAFRREQPEERALLQTTAWASLTTTLRIASRVQIPASPPA